MKVVFDFNANKFVKTETENGINLPCDDTFIIYVIKAAVTEDKIQEYQNNYWLITKEQEKEQKELMSDYYFKNSSFSQNPFDEDDDPDNYEQYEQERMDDPLMAVEGLNIEEELFNMGEYKVSSVMYYHNTLDSHFFYRFKKL